LGPHQVCALDAEGHAIANEVQVAIAHQGTGEQSRFRQNLEAVANADDQTAPLGMFDRGLQGGRKTGDRATPQIVAIAKSPWHNDQIRILQIAVFMPNHLGRLTEQVAGDVGRVAIAISARKNNHADIHGSSLPKIRGKVSS
jgi:hypothetical protein